MSLRGFLVISLFLPDRSGHTSTNPQNLEFSPGVISLTRTRAISEIRLSRTFFPFPSEFKIAGLDYI